MKKLAAEFKAFIMRGNVLDMAIGVIVATAFGKITTSLVNDVLMPLISWIVGARDMTVLNLVVRPGYAAIAPITIGFGTFLGTVIDFVLISLVVFAIVKTCNKVHEAATRKKQEEAPASPEAAPKPGSEELLAQILEELKKH